MKRFAVAADGIDDLRRTAVPRDRPDITRLTATPGVEDGAVEEQPVFDYLEDVAFGHARI
jgi:hypothetical protein